MFWDNNDAIPQNIEALLEKENLRVEELLEEDDIIQECKTKKKSIINYFTRPDVIKRLIELVTTEPPEDLPMDQRFRHANVACEVLLLGLPSLDEKLIADVDTLNSLYSYLENEPPLNPLLASFFSKTFSMLFTKKSDQDWFLYQQLCLKLLEYLKTQNNFLDLICKHFTTPVIPDLIMEMMSNVEGLLRKSLYDWLNDERLVEKLIEIIGDPEQSEKHANVAEFLCDLIQQGRTMRQTDQNNDLFEPTFEGSNPILKNIESATTLFALFNVILQPNALESAIVAGITVVLKIIKPAIIIDERNPDRLEFLQDREKEIHDELLSTVIRVIEPQLKHFNELLRNPPNKHDIVTSAAKLSPPFGMTRLQICRLFTVLLQTNNEEIAKAICETDFLDILLSLFKQYCWNNFLHSEVEKCFQTIFYTALPNNNNSTRVSTGFDSNIFINQHDTDLNVGPKVTPPATEAKEGTGSENKKQETTVEQLDVSRASNSSEGEGDVTKHPTDSGPSAIQAHVISHCKVVSNLLECWQINRETESAENGRRLGYMGHLIKIFKHITNCISESEHIGALIESNFKDDAERELWQSIVNATDGELTKALNIQSKLLANCEACDYDISLDFLTNNDFSGEFNTLCGITDSIDTDTDVIFTLDYNTQHDSDDDNNDDGDGNDSGDKEPDTQCTQHVKNALDLFQFGRNNDDDEDDDEENAAAGGCGSNEAKRLKDALRSYREFEKIFVVDDESPKPSSKFKAVDEIIGGAAIPSEEEYNNNANVERFSFLFSPNDHSPFQLQKDITTTYTKNNFVDYYEDDEGMWTKPLGASASSTADLTQEAAASDTTACSESVGGGGDNASSSSSSAFTNGPTNANLGLEEVADNVEPAALATTELNNSKNEDSIAVGDAVVDTTTISSGVTQDNQLEESNLLASVEHQQEATTTPKAALVPNHVVESNTTQSN